MARFVKLTVVYDMEEPEKTLGAELLDWIEGNVTLWDIDESMPDQGFELVEIGEAQAMEWLGSITKS